MMNRKRLIFKRLAIILATLTITITLLITLIVHLFLTPEKLTPLVTEKLQEYINSEVSIKEIDATFLSTYPRLTIRMDSLRIRQMNDSISDLLSVKSCKISVNPIAILFKKLIVNEIEVTHPNINLYRDEIIKPLKIFNLQIDTLAKDTTESSIDMSKYDFVLKRIVLDSSVIVINDKIRDFYAKVDGLSTNMKLIIDNKRVILDADTDLNDINVVNLGNTLISNLSIGLDSDIELDRDSLLLKFKQADLTLNKIDLKADGLIRGDTTNKSIYVDINGALKSPSLAEFINLVPMNFIEDKDKLTTSGNVSLNLSINGEYSENENGTLYPNLTANLNINNGTAKFSNRKVSVDNVDCNADMFVNFNLPKESYISLNSFNISSLDIIDLSLAGKISEILGNPSMDLDIKSDIDFSRFSEVFPLKNGVIFNGKSSSDLHAKFTLDDINNSNYGNLYINGESLLNSVDISIDGAKFYNDSTLTSYMYLEVEEGKLVFGDRVKSNNSRTLLANINFTGLGFKDRDGQYILIKNVDLSAGANFDNKTGKPNGVGMQIKASDLDLGIEEQLNGHSKSSDFLVTITPKTEEKNAHIHATITSDSLKAKERINNSDLVASNINMEVDLLKQEEKKWDMSGNIGFNNLNIFTDMFPLNISINKSALDFTNNEIKLNNTRVDIGRSNMLITGSISNMLQSMFSANEQRRKKMIEGNLKIKSRFLDANELMEATNKSVLLSEAESEGFISDSLNSEIDSLYIANLIDSTAIESSLPLIPRGVSFTLNLNVDSLEYSRTSISNIDGTATINKGVLSLQKLNFNTIGASANTTMYYNNINRESANIYFAMDINNMDISRVGELMPSIDTLMPMIKSFEGIVDCTIKGTTLLNADLTSNLKTLKCGISMKGKELVLMDSETFTELSKKLMFKNKDKNIIDSLNVDVTIDTLNIGVLPFEVTIDRYKAIVGGDQILDESTYDIVYNYNVSIIKSPLPFKAGVDIYGDLNDYDFNITKAKLKNTDFELQKSNYNEWLSTIKYEEKRDSLFFTQRTPRDNQGREARERGENGVRGENMENRESGESRESRLNRVRNMGEERATNIDESDDSEDSEDSESISNESIEDEEIVDETIEEETIDNESTNNQ